MRNLVFILFIIILGTSAYFLLFQKEQPPTPSQDKTEEISGRETEEIGDFKQLDFLEFNSSFLFSGSIPEKFEIEYIPQLKAISIYDTADSGSNIREKSQIYITYFEADRFLTLKTVDIIKREKISIGGREAVFYEIAKKSGVPEFYEQPEWRNKKHKAIDIRLTKSEPSLFYSFAYNPNLSEEIFNNFINSLKFY